MIVDFYDLHGLDGKKNNYSLKDLFSGSGQSCKYNLKAVERS